MTSLAVWAPRRPFLLTVASALLVFLLGAQVWIGILLTFDEEGPLTRFNPPDSDSSASSALIHVDGARSAPGT
jgi:hypothetical protein